MTFTELESELERLLIKSSSYRINLPAVDNTYAIQFDGKHTKVFYSERGTEFDLKSYDKKDDAMLDFMQRILKDQTTRIDFDGTIK